MIRLLIIASVLTGIVPPVVAQQDRPTAVGPDDLHWISPPLPGVEIAWAIGSETASGAYVQRVRLAPNTTIPVHTHPDERVSTVLSGTLRIGFGETIDKSQGITVPAGGLYRAPAGMPHYVWSEDQTVVYQESGHGPTATRFKSR